MPPFRDDLDAKSRAEIIAYVLWLSSDGRLPDTIVAGDTTEGPGTSSSAVNPSAQPVAVGRGSGIPARGAVLFFDATKLYSCRICHSYGGKGGPVGPDLIDMEKTPLQIYGGLIQAGRSAPGFPALSVTLHDGGRIVGIQSESTDDVLRVFDVSSLPPVKRSVRRSEIAHIAAISDRGIYEHATLPFSKQDLIDLSAFLGKQSAAARGGSHR
jgi:putative heme-binding domain-containing protein